MDTRVRLRAGRERARLRWVGGCIEERLGHLRAAGVVHTCEKDRLHEWACTAGHAGTSQRESAVAAAAPVSCATTKPGTSTGRTPAKVSVSARPMVTAGFANDVETVNQYAAVM